MKLRHAEANFIWLRLDEHTTAFADTGLAASASFSYRVRATDAAGNLGPYSNVSTAATGDTQPPTAPSSLLAHVVSSTQINLTWTAATDNAAVTAYLVERCQGVGCATFAQIAERVRYSPDGCARDAHRRKVYRQAQAACCLGFPCRSPLSDQSKKKPRVQAPTPFKVPT